jgi:hypothetical protein
MAQGNNITGQKGTNAMFVMAHDELNMCCNRTKKSLMEIQLSIIGCKRRIHIEFEYWQEKTLSHMNPALPSAQ